MALFISPLITGEAAPRLAACGDRRGQEGRTTAGHPQKGHKVSARLRAPRAGSVPCGTAGLGRAQREGRGRTPRQPAPSGAARRLTCPAGGAGGGSGPTRARLLAPLPLAEITLNTCRSPPVSLQALARPPVNQAGAPPRRGFALPRRRTAAAADAAPEWGCVTLG